MLNTILVNLQLENLHIHIYLFSILVHRKMIAAEEVAADISETLFGESTEAIEESTALEMDGLRNSYGLKDKQFTAFDTDSSYDINQWMQYGATSSESSSSYFSPFALNFELNSGAGGDWTEIELSNLMADVSESGSEIVIYSSKNPYNSRNALPLSTMLFGSAALSTTLFGLASGIQIEMTGTSSYSWSRNPIDRILIVNPFDGVLENPFGTKLTFKENIQPSGRIKHSDVTKIKPKKNVSNKLRKKRAVIEKPVCNYFISRDDFAFLNSSELRRSKIKKPFKISRKMSETFSVNEMKKFIKNLGLANYYIYPAIKQILRKKYSLFGRALTSCFNIFS
jgi:hypothetical protein